jgi:hypothetical protein
MKTSRKSGVFVMQATGRTSKDTKQSAAHGVRTQSALRQQLGWTLACALLTTLAEAMFVLSQMPSSMVG